MAEKITELISEDLINTRVRHLGERISREYAGKSIHLICILKGSIFFFSDLAKRINLPITMDFMSVSSYGSGTESKGDVRIKKDLDDSIKGKHVIVVEDIVDSGYTISKLIPILKSREPASLEVATLLDKPDRRKVDVEVKYTCFDIPDEFVVGYGLDYDQKYRDLPYVGVIRFDEN
ncbi:MAG: hypoxanthine phosphoribosyltransferase [Lachnospiraceae bacterium]|nr:hypoxanthine phosphoribosyltransferase [Lachnospiraceae bacterium]